MEGSTVFTNLMNGGWMMIPLFVCSIVSVGIIIERARYFRYACSIADVDQIFSYVAKNKIADAIRIARESEPPVLKVFIAGLTHRNAPDVAMESATIAHIATLKRRLPALETIITLAPLLGLLGTIIGMIDSFQIMSLTGNSQPHAVTGGVAEALICTATGICVAVLTLIPYNYFLSRVDRETEKIEEYATRLELLLRGESNEELYFDDQKISERNISNKEYIVAEEAAR
jgi:biopolymer transport protein ExbB